MDQSSDSMLVTEVLAGNTQAFAHLVNRYKRQMYNLTLRMTANPETAQDLSQETFVRAYANLHRYKPEASFFNWLYTICINLTRNYLSKKRELLTGNQSDEGEREDSAPSSGLRTPEIEIMEQQNISGLEAALGALPLDLREAVLLRYLQELSFDDVANTLGISLSAAKMRVYRGLEKLRTVMTDQGITHEI